MPWKVIPRVQCQLTGYPWLSTIKLLTVHYLDTIADRFSKPRPHRRERGNQTYTLFRNHWPERK